MPALTVKQVQSIIKNKRFGRHSDGNGLYLNIRKPEGTASWVFRFTLFNKRYWMGLGSVDSSNGLAWAREQVIEYKNIVKQGVDPRVERKRRNDEMRKKNDLEKNTFSVVAESYIEDKKSGWKNQKHHQQWRNTLTKYAYPKIGSKPVHLIDIYDVQSILKPIWYEKTETAKRVRSRVELVLTYATALKMREGANPAAWKGNLDALLPSPSKIHKVKHLPALPYEKLQNVLNEISSQDGVPARALEFAILTGSRTKPIRLAKWHDIDFEKQIWNCPEDNMKSGKFFRIPLTNPALDIINSLREYSLSDYIFANERTGKIMSENAMNLVLHRLGYKGLATTHGMRSTLRDWAGETTNFSERIVEVCLAHTVNGAVEAAYQRGDYMEKRKVIMKGWADFCYPPKGKVVPINTQFNKTS